MSDKPCPYTNTKSVQNEGEKDREREKWGSDVEAGKLGRFKQKSVILAQFYSKYILCFLYEQMLNLLFMLMQKLLKQKRRCSRVAVRRRGSKG